MTGPQTPAPAPAPAGIHARRPERQDAAAITAVVRAAETAACGDSLADGGDLLFPAARGYEGMVPGVGGGA
jgi:hypothetical protein